jgi:anthranilate synthase/indole-3-glycerol phosphate synthase/phosphoribosylanthranilate isomerase
MLAGGLNPSNVKQVFSGLASSISQVAILDVSSGVEENGEQSLSKIREFVTAVKTGA